MAAWTTKKPRSPRDQESPPGLVEPKTKCAITKTWVIKCNQVKTITTAKPQLVINTQSTL